MVQILGLSMPGEETGLFEIKRISDFKTTIKLNGNDGSVHIGGNGASGMLSLYTADDTSRVAIQA
jgi:hypothetical protein